MSNISDTNDTTQVDTLSKLCKLSFSEEEKNKISQEFNNILHFVNVIQQADTTKIDSKEKNLSSDIVSTDNVMREDIVKEGLSRDITQKLAPQFVSGHIVVPAVIKV